MLIARNASKLVTMTSVVSSHEILDRDLTLANLNTKRYIRNSFTTQASKTIAAAIFGSRLDFYN